MHSPAPRRAEVSWALYDLANTMLYAVVVTVWLPLYVQDITGRVGSVGTATVLAMLGAGLLSPIAGALTDRTGKAKQFLFYATALCCAAAVLMSFVGAYSIFLLLGAYVLMNLAYQVAMVFYNALLPSLTSPDRLGWTSGLGVALGYFGVFLAIPLSFVVAGTIAPGSPLDLGARWTFATGGILFFLFAIPLFVWVPERKVADPQAPSRALIREEFRSLGHTLRELVQHRPLLFFFIGNFLIVDAVNTTILYISPFLEGAVGVARANLTQVILLLNLSAFAGGFAFGNCCDRWGTKTAYLAAALCFFVAIASCALPGDPSLLLTLVVLFGGAGLAGVWVAGRNLVIQLAPTGQAGRYLGFYGLTNKLSAIESLSFGLLADAYNYRIAALSLLLALVPGIAFVIAARVPHRGTPGLPPIYRFFFYPLTRILFGALYRLRVTGTHHVPREGPVIIAAHHQSYIDPIFVHYGSPRVIRYMAMRQIWKVPLLGRLVGALSAFPVNTEGGDLSSYRQAKRVLDQGHVLGIFPEGGRTATGLPEPFRTGYARLAHATGAVIVPVALRGAYRVWPKGQLLPHLHGHIEVEYLPPLPRSGPAPDDHTEAHDLYRREADALRELLRPHCRP